MHENEQQDAKADRERRSFNRLEAGLTNVGGSIQRLLHHVEALSTITGVHEKEEFSPSPRPGEKTSHMETCLIDVKDFKQWADTLYNMFEKQISELVPDFYATKLKP